MKSFLTLIVLFLLPGLLKAQSGVATSPEDAHFLPFDRGVSKYDGTPTPLYEIERIPSDHGGAVGTLGVIAADIDGDGEIEVVTGGSQVHFGAYNFWYVLEYDSETESYQTTWTSNFLPDIVALSAADPDGDGIYTIYTILETGDLVAYDGRTYIEKARNRIVNNPNFTVSTEIIVADLDGDDQPELVTNFNGFLTICDPIDLSIKARPNGVPEASTIDVGNVDEDAALELATSGGLIYTYSANTLHLEWDYSSFFGHARYIMRLGDTNNDGRDELIYTSGFDVHAFNTVTESLVWSIEEDNIVDIQIQDFDADGREDLLLVAHFEALQHDLTTGQFIKKRAHGDDGLAIGDLDQDGELEAFIVWNAHSTAPDELAVYDFKSGTREWLSTELGGQIFAIDRNDLDGDGRDELVYAGTEGIIIRDAETHALKWSREEGTKALRIADVDGDNRPDIVTGEHVLDALSLTTKTRYRSIDLDLEFSTTTSSLAVADVDQDGEMEIALGLTTDTRDQDIHLYVLNGATGIVEWRSISVGKVREIYQVRVGNVDNDPQLEIVVVVTNLVSYCFFSPPGSCPSPGSFIMVFDGRGTLEGVSEPLHIFGLELLDLNKDGIDELYGGSYYGSILQIDGQTLTTQQSFEVSTFPLMTLQKIDADADGAFELAYGDFASYGIFDLEENRILFSTPPTYYLGGPFHNMLATQVDGHTHLYAGDFHMLAAYETAQPTAVPSTILPPGRPDLGPATPNPFNQTTHFQYSLSHPGPVRLNVYDIWGRRVAQLIDKKQSSGTYNVNWTPEGLPAGMYFYRLESINSITTRSVVFIR